ncbi:MAG TPA: alkaline phosphatase family protein [Thermoanaerobaculia bacterium]|jgi:phospholipase C
MSNAFLPQIENIVFLMLENRSLDNLLGWLYAGNDPMHVYPAGSSTTYDGLNTGAYSNPYRTAFSGVQNYPVVRVPDNLGGDWDRVPGYDPYEEMKANSSWNGVLNQLFGNENRIGGLPGSGTPAKMLGFLQDYYSWYMATWKGLDILWTYPPSMLPVINTLARMYAVSDAWFCSVPTQTNPNRAFSLCGTSLGRENNATLTAVEQFPVPTVINSLVDAGRSWGLFFTDVWKNNLSYTEYTFPYLTKAGGARGSIDDFIALAKAGKLPSFSYLEPKWGYGKGTIFTQGTDYHPPTHIAPGEQFLAQIYGALRTSPQWEKTLFIVTFDEHGGTYDHVAPRWGAINPDGKIGADGFRFDLFGARVPTLLISPYVANGTVFRAPSGSKYPFDHTSFIKTFLLWAGVDPNSAPLGKRVPAAPTFEGVLSPTVVNALTFEAPLLATALDHPDVSQGAGGAGQPVNALVEGIPFAATRAILNSADSLPEVEAGVARYKADPEAFEASLG